MKYFNQPKFVEKSDHKWYNHRHRSIINKYYEHNYVENKHDAWKKMYQNEEYILNIAKLLDEKKQSKMNVPIQILDKHKIYNKR